MKLNDIYTKPLMPMKKNIPKGHPEWSLVKCPICGQECWRPMSRQEIRQKKMIAACTECGLKNRK